MVEHFLLRIAIRRRDSHISCFAIDMAKDLILLSCRLAMEHLCVLQLATALATLVTTHGLHWPTVDEGLYTAALTSVSLMLLGRRNETTGGSVNNLARPSSTVGQCKPFGDKRCNLVLSPIATHTSVP
jgi:hypothetical protein